MASGRMQQCLLWVSALAVLTSLVSAQVISRENCPASYQTSYNFTDNYINNTLTRKEGFVVVATNTAPNRCQQLGFNSSNRAFRFSYIDDSNQTLTTANGFLAVNHTLYSPGKITLVATAVADVPVRQQTLWPIIVTEQFLVLVSCQDYVLDIFTQSKLEEIIVLVPAPYTGSPTVEDVMNTVKSTIYYPTLTESLKNVNTTCTATKATVTRSSQQQPGFFNFLASMTRGSIFPARSEVEPTYSPPNPITAIGNAFQSLTGAAAQADVAETPATRGDAALTNLTLRDDDENALEPSDEDKDEVEETTAGKIEEATEPTVVNEASTNDEQEDDDVQSVVAARFNRH